MLPNSGRTVQSKALLARAMLVLSGLVAALPTMASGPVVTDVWVRPTVPGQPVGAAYFTITSAKSITITQVQSAAAGTVQMHTMTLVDGVMRMRQLERVALRAGETIQFSPGGMHLMLLDLKERLQLGDTVSFEFTMVDEAGAQRVVHTVAPVKAAPAR